MSQKNPLHYENQVWKVRDATDKINIFVAGNVRSKQDDLKSILTQTIDLVYAQMVSFTMFLGLGFAILACNDVVDQTTLTRYSNINLFNFKVSTAIILFAVFIVIFHSLITKMNELQD